jgi:hypothetical protein
MRHDAKLGLALGMLVIGFAIAFCFPRQPDRTTWSTPKIPVPITDPALEFLPVRAYQSAPATTGSGESPAQSRVAPVPQTPLPTPAQTLAGTVAFAMPIIPAPPAPNPQQSLTPQGDSVPAPARVETPPKEPKRPVPQIYTVQPGDTLSAIAIRVLGDGQRYLEIYETNKDRLATPHDLKIGLELRMPAPRADLVESERRGEVEEPTETQLQHAQSEIDAQAR